MKILININHRRQFSILNNFSIGLQRHNNLINVIHAKKMDPQVLSNTIHSHDLVVGWGVKNNVYKLCKAYKKDFLVMERGYMLDRFYWTSCGFNGLNGDADFLNTNVSSARWDQIFSKQIHLMEWNKNGQYALVAGQVRKDASVKHLDIYSLYSNYIKQLNSLGIPVIFRPHPLEKNKQLLYNNLKFDYDYNTKLEDTLKSARFVVTINSNVGVVSLIHGVPVISLDKKSMVYDYTTHSLEDNILYPDRIPWCHKMAYTQWNPQEIRNGTTWEHLKERYK